ncbi:kinetochore protein Spc25 [Kwoniella mangroviensis CBS 8886]|nr:kinetochore protein Spc25 [Kwoniella mangroviensis CBS 8886]
MAPSNYHGQPGGYLPRPISLQAILDESSSNNTSPSIDLQWEPFQRHVEAFLTAIDDYTIAAKTEIAARASDHLSQMRDLKAEREEVERRIKLEREREGEMLATLESERHTLTDLTSSLNHLESSLQKVKDQSSSLESELNVIRKEVTTERTEKDRQKSRLNEMRKRDERELIELEENVGFTVNGIRPDLLMMRFTLLDHRDPTREFSFLIDISKQGYTVPNCDPPIPNLSELVRQLNHDRDIYTFIKRVRKSFRALIPNPASSTRFDELSGPGLGLRTPAMPGNHRVLSHSTKDNVIVDGTAMDGLSLTNRMK